MSNELTFESLVGNVEHVHNITSSYAKGAVNQLLTVRNWMIGYYSLNMSNMGSAGLSTGQIYLEKWQESLISRDLIGHI